MRVSGMLEVEGEISQRWTNIQRLARDIVGQVRSL